jgi:hypothetical protein
MMLCLSVSHAMNANFALRKAYCNIVATRLTTRNNGVTGANGYSFLQMRVRRISKMLISDAENVKVTSRVRMS